MNGEEWCCECDAFPEVRLHQWATLVAWWWGNEGPIYSMHIVDVWGGRRWNVQLLTLLPTLPGYPHFSQEEQRLYPPFSVFHLYVGYPPIWGRKPW